MERSMRWKLLTLLALVAISIYYLVPSFRLYSLPPDQRYGTADESVKKLRGNALKLGLDLLGGMNIVLEVDRSKLKPEEVPDAVDRVMQILRNRIDQFGVAEPLVQKQGDDRILVQLPGLMDKSRAVDLIGRTAQLEFKIVKTAPEARQVIERLDNQLARRMGGAASADGAAAADSSAGGDSTDAEQPLISRLYNYPDMGQFGGVAILPSDVSAVEQLLKQAAADTLLPRESTLALSQKSEVVGGQAVRILYVLNRRADFTGAGIKSAIMRIGLDASRPNDAGVSITMNSKGTAAFRKTSGANIGRQLAIVLDDRVVSAPVIRDRISQGSAQITGNFNTQEANDLAIVLRAGALPAPVNVIEERTVGPSLGRDSIAAGLRAAWVGGALVVGFMLIYYRLCGVVSIVGLFFNMFFLIAGLAMLKGTLTLPGIAGIALTVGMAVDANVLIFERIREELRNGKRVKPAIEAGYHRAFTTILDSNLTTFISAVCLYFFGSGPIRGFAVTLGIGILANLFTAVALTRMLFDLSLANKNPEKLSI
ncbi:MAG: protein translocase subunit SecD [Candidatus Eisenbacteria bacterium]|nr:protein translocase subunit SecD [Candidatus Eisenbacteria bacterium]MCC7143246.1 protein translocase subunit SecD [Candidatus Eisenbacteria bacterium]